MLGLLGHHSMSIVLKGIALLQRGVQRTAVGLPVTNSCGELWWMAASGGEWWQVVTSGGTWWWRWREVRWRDGGWWRGGVLAGGDVVAWWRVVAWSGGGRWLWQMAGGGRGDRWRRVKRERGATLAGHAHAWWLLSPRPTREGGRRGKKGGGGECGRGRREGGGERVVDAR